MARHSKRENWKWADADPLARGVIAAFSGRMGQNPGELNTLAFVGSLTEAFITMNGNDIYSKLGRSGLTAIRRDIITELQKPEAALDSLIYDMNALAQPGQLWTAAHQSIIAMGTREEASGILEDMSSTAAEKLIE